MLTKDILRLQQREIASLFGDQFATRVHHLPPSLRARAIARACCELSQQPHTRIARVLPNGVVTDVRVAAAV